MEKFSHKTAWETQAYHLLREKGLELCGHVSSMSDNFGFEIMCTEFKGHNGYHSCKAPVGYTETTFSWSVLPECDLRWRSEEWSCASDFWDV